MYTRFSPAPANPAGRSASSATIASAVSAYPDHHDLSDRTALVVARTSHDPALLKPDPYLINEAVSALGVDTTSTALVGDSFTDVEAAQRARG
jgi:phosphoglycolate phosphatase-like HAD superfamily hydrolase